MFYEYHSPYYIKRREESNSNDTDNKKQIKKTKTKVYNIIMAKLNEVTTMITIIVIIIIMREQHGNDYH